MIIVKTERTHLWTPEKKEALVLLAFRGTPIKDICAEYGITQDLYYEWRNQFLANITHCKITSKKHDLTSG